MRNIILISILLAGGGLRFSGISNQSLWLDELASWEKSAKPDIQSVLTEVRKDVHPPGYQFLLYYIEKYGGDSEWHLRLPSVLAGIASIFFIYLVGATLYTSREGLTAAGLLASSWAPLYYSHEARAYSLLLCFGLASVYLGLLLLKQLRCGNTPSWYLSGGYIATAASLCYLHYFGVLLVGIEAVWLIVSSLPARRALSYTCIIFIGIFLLYSPWVPSIFGRLEGGDVGLPAPTPRAVNNYFLFLFNWSQWYLYFFIAPIIGLFLVKNIVCYFQLDRRQPYAELFSSPGFFLLMWFLAPVAITYTVSIYWAPIWTNRNLLVSLPPVYLLVARAVSSLPTTILKNATAFVLMAFSLYIVVFQLEYYSSPHKQQWREAAAFVADFEMKSKEEFPVMTFAYNKSHLNYYLQKLNGREIAESFGEKEDIPELEKFIHQNHYSPFWYVVIHRKPDKEFVSYLQNNFSVLQYKGFYEADVYLLRKKRR